MPIRNIPFSRVPSYASVKVQKWRYKGADRYRMVNRITNACSKKYSSSFKQLLNLLWQLKQIIFKARIILM
ncbi:MAG: hypothetical protein JWR61_431 [Ferruginibacter sp.]|nr:hypothetical protein [Ferruginibacter sp.]